MKRILATLGCAVMTVSSAWAVPVEVAVDVELALLVDVSGSIDDDEFTLQKGGYVTAFQSAAVQNLITDTTGGRIGKIAVNLIYWSSGGQQQLAVPWTVIDSAASADAFAAAVSATTRPFDNNTAPGSAIAFATTNPAADFVDNGFAGTRLVIDVSGDGTENSGVDTSDARDAALTTYGVDRINGLVIGNQALADWYANNVQGGAGSFVIRVDGFDDFADAVESKLKFEISGGTPTSDSGPTLFLGMAGFGLLLSLRRRLAAR